MTTIPPLPDPLTVLPPEIILRIFHFSPISSLASLSAVSKAWNKLLDTHQEVIYSSESKTTQPAGGARDFSFLSESRTFSKFFEGTESWKDLCKRQTLLSRNWAQSQPVGRESVFQIGNDPVWRFQPDFKRRFFVSTSQVGGLNVTDMDTGAILWRLPSILDRAEDAVRPFAHLEYQDGIAVFDREGDAVEVWQADLEGAQRGEFRRIAILPHNCQTRGFKLSFSTLCVVSSEGQGFVYDMTQKPPKLVTHLEIEQEGIGHLDQSEDVVIYSMGPKGFFAYDKKSGAFLGNMQPTLCTEKYHVRPPSSSPSLAETTRHNLAHPPGTPRKDYLAPVTIAKGPLPTPTNPHHIHRENEWGSGMLHDDLFVGFSRAGQVFVCSNWRKALHEGVAAHSFLLECETDGSNFDLGGWLSVRNHRLMFEIHDRLYVIALDDNNQIPDTNTARASYSLHTSSAPQFSVPVSFMTLCDDAIMTTYTTLGWRQNIPGIQQHEGPARIFPTKAIRVINLAPILSDKESASTSNPGPQNPPAINQAFPVDGTLRSQAGLWQLISMLGGGLGEDDDDDDDDEHNELGVFGDAVIDDVWEDEEDEEDEEEDQDEENEQTHGGA